MKLTDHMHQVLNKGLNYSVLPSKVDNTLILAEHKKFERTILWRQFWADRDSTQNSTIPIFNLNKTNFPNLKPAESLTMFLGSIKSDIMNPQNRNRVQPNLSNLEQEALLDLIKLQQSRTITIKQCDKGAGIIILNHEEYLKSCYNHLSMTHNISGNLENYYEKVTSSVFEDTKVRVEQILKEAFNNEQINKNELDAMNPKGKPPARFYCTYKVHKQHLPPQTPPERPIISASGSCLENIGKYVQYHIKDIGTSHDSYLKDTPNFLNLINEANENTIFPDDTILVTMDVSALYTNIPHEEGLNCMEEALNEKNIDQSSLKFHKGLVLRLLDILLHNNVFEFDSKLYKQITGAAMGSPPIPSYANIFMAGKIDKNILNIVDQMSKSENMTLKMFKRFLDDLFFIFSGQTKTLHKMLDKINQIHPAIKLTMSHTKINEKDPCKCPKLDQIPFLDVSLSLNKGKICTDLYKKPTDKNQYLLPSSCHPPDCMKNIPFSLALRIVKICSDSINRDLRLGELKQMLLDREYDESIIDSAIRRAIQIPRAIALEPKKQSQKNDLNRPVYVSTYDPRVPNIKQIVKKNIGGHHVFWTRTLKNRFQNPL